MKRTILTTITLIPLLTFGQPKVIPVNISLFNEATAIPFTGFFTLPIHPGIQAGTEFDYRSNEHSRLFQTANINYFYHNHLNQGIGIYTEFGYEYCTAGGFAISGLLGIGYLHTFAVSEEFTFSNEQYQKKADRGNARLFPSVSLDIGYYIFHEKENSPKIFLRYQSWAEYPYSPGFIPIMTHINLHIGTKLFITRIGNDK